MFLFILKKVDHIDKEPCGQFSGIFSINFGYAGEFGCQKNHVGWTVVRLKNLIKVLLVSFMELEFWKLFKARREFWHVILDYFVRKRMNAELSTSRGLVLGRVLS